MQVGADEARQPLAGKVALVAGAARGAGRGIARMLGEAGATVYCTGRSSSEAPARVPKRPETIEETAGLVNRAGGLGIPLRVDHAVEAEVAALAAQLRAEHGGLDLLVNVLGGSVGPQQASFWEGSLETGRALLDTWLWPHLVTCRYLAPLLAERGAGLLVEVVEGETLAYPQFRGNPLWDLVMTSLKRLAYAVGEELAPKGVAALAVAPGFMRTEAVLDHLSATEQNWRTVAAQSPAARAFGFAGSETPCFVGRGVAALAADPRVMEKTGELWSSWELSEIYGFTDLDGGQPNWGRFFAENFPELAKAPTRTGRRWRIESAVG